MTRTEVKPTFSRNNRHHGDIVCEQVFQLGARCFARQHDHDACERCEQLPVEDELAR